MSQQPPPQPPQKTELHFACCRGDPKLIIEAVKKGISINAPDDKLCTPLHVAARYNHTEVCRFLMSQGADMTLQDNVSWHPLPAARPCPPRPVPSAAPPRVLAARTAARRGGPRARLPQPADAPRRAPTGGEDARAGDKVARGQDVFRRGGGQSRSVHADTRRRRCSQDECS